MKLLLIATMLTLICCCSSIHNPHTITVVSDSLKQLRADSIRLDTLLRLEDSTIKLRMAAIEEPQIDTYKRIVYRYTYSRAFGITYIFRAEQLPDSSYILVSKCILPWGIKSYSKLPSFSYKSGHYSDLVRGEIDSFILFTGIQKLDKQYWNRFVDLLRGSYYWTFTDHVTETGPFDGDELQLISKSFWPRRRTRNDTLTYHVNYIPCPFEGSFTEAYTYLAMKSILFKKFKLPADIFPIRR